jgi:hypothetical protein
MLDWIERFDDPDEVRRAWRRLRGFSVLHPDCPDGGRLVTAGITLEVVLTAVLERMQSFVADSHLRRDNRRPEHLRDLRNLTEAAEGPACGYDRARYLRRLIVQQNLFATVSSRTAGRAVLRDLLRFGGTDDPGIPLIDCNIWRRKGSEERDDSPFPRADRDVGTGFDSPLEEEVALHRKAWEMVRRARIAGGDFGELKRAGGQLQRRRQLLLRQLRQLIEVEEPCRAPEGLVFCRHDRGRGFAAIVSGMRPG